MSQSILSGIGGSITIPYLSVANSSEKNSGILVPGVLYTHMRHFLLILLIHPWLCFFHILLPVQQQVWCGPTVAHPRFWDDLPPSITPLTVDPCCVLESLLGDGVGGCWEHWVKCCGWGRAVWVTLKLHCLQCPGEFCYCRPQEGGDQGGACSPGFLPVNLPHTHLYLIVNPPYKSLSFRVLVTHPCFHSIRPRDGTISAPISPRLLNYSFFSFLSCPHFEN